jgi:hypothetical protein
MKKINRRKSLGLFLLLGLAALTPVFSSAASGPVTLTCVKDGTTADNGSFQLILDEGAKTAVFAQNPVSPAVFTDTTVKWKADIVRSTNYHLQLFYNLARQTGVLTQTFIAWTVVNGQENDSHGTSTYHCSAAQ